MSDPRRHGQIFFRLRPSREIEQRFDEWQRKRHGPRLVQAPGAVHFGYFRRPETNYLGSNGPTRMDYYTAESEADLRAWMESEELRRELADGQQGMDALQTVDGQPFSANVYLPYLVEGARPPADAAVYAFRLELEEHEVDAFGEWLIERCLPAARTVPGVVLVRAFHAVRRDIPIPLYCSPGNRMIRIELEPAQLEDAIGSPEFQRVLDEQRRWDAPGRYATQDVFEHVFHLDSCAARSAVS
jgi:hypothetical protein